MRFFIILLSIALCIFSSCKYDSKKNALIEENISLTFHERMMKEISEIPTKTNSIDTNQMIKVKGGSFLMGATSDQARADEYPVHQETVKGFYIDKTEVTNAAFSTFVEATNYKTLAERPIDAEHIAKLTGVDKKTINTDPVGLVFTGDPNMWWASLKGANWKHPQGPKSSIEGKEDHPVVQISWYDAMAYCKWAGKRLPTEEEFEYAARNQGKRIKYFWGNDFTLAPKKTNFHQGSFPVNNLLEDNFKGLAPVKSFPANDIGIYDIGGNVWEWTLNSYFEDAYQRKLNFETPKYEEDNNIHQRKVIRGGSFLCNESYCSGYRVSARMSSSPDTGLEHTGFRCVADVVH